MSYSEFDFPHTHYYDTDLRELIYKVTKILSTVEMLKDWKEQHEDEYAQLKELYDNLMAGNYPPSFEESLTRWLQINAMDIVGELVKMVIFNITDDGYFVAYIPESWDEIIFNTTGLDIDLALQPEYGHLVLSYAGNTNAY